MKLAAALLACAAFLPAVSASAAEAPSMGQVRNFLADYGKCIVKRAPELSQKAVVSGASFNRESPDGRLLTQSECINAENLRNTSRGFQGRVRMPDEIYRGAIAEALVLRDGTQLAAAAVAAIPALTYEEIRPLRTTDRDGKPIPEDRLERQRAAIARKTGAQQVGKLGECVVRQLPDASRAVLSTQIETPGELASLNALAPALQQCVPAGETISLDRMSLRGALAIAYYRLANAGKTAGATQ